MKDSGEKSTMLQLITSVRWLVCNILHTSPIDVHLLFSRSKKMVLVLLPSLLLWSSFLFNSDLQYYIIIPIILICIIIELSLLISLNYYCYYNILFHNSNDFCSQLSFPIIFVYLFVCLLPLCAPAIYRSRYVVSVHYVPMYICTVLCL
jgi:hypothetical protein